MKRALIALIAVIAIMAPASGCMGGSSATGDIADLHIMVTNASGVPLVGAKVVSDIQPANQMKLTGLTDSGGNVTFARIKTGAYKFYVSRFDYEQTEVSTNVTEVNHELTMKMTPVGGSPGST